MPQYDAIVIGSGPNGLSAAISLAKAGRSVLVREGSSTIGGSARSAELTLPGFTHDICSAVHALARVSPFLSSLPLADHGLELIDPPAPFAHPLENGRAIVAERSLETTADSLGEDGQAYLRLMRPIVESWDRLVPEILAPAHFPRHPILLAKFGAQAIRCADALARSRFAGAAARAFFAGVCAHSCLPLKWTATSAFGLVLLASAHADGWPVARGGSQMLADALASLLKSLGGKIEVDSPVMTLAELPQARAVLCDVTPRQFLKLAGLQLPDAYRQRLVRYRYGPGAFKMDWALRGPIPWKNPGCARAGTIHLGASLEEIAASERSAWGGRETGGSAADRPYVLLVQPSLFDPTRAPAGKHTAWAYCHVPNGSTRDRTDAIESQIERYAPGFRDRILARSVLNPAALERHNPNLVGGDVNGGSADIFQLFARPVAAINPYATPIPGVYLCSSSTPPGGGVHGMCGFFAAHAVMAAKDGRPPAPEYRG